LGSVQTMVAKIDWSKFKNIFEAVGQAKLFECIEELPLKKEQHIDRPKLITPIPDSNNSLISTIKKEVAEMIGIDSADLNEDKSLNMLGLDSLMAVGLRNRLNKNLGFDIPIVKFIDGSSIVDLAELLAGEKENSDSEIVGGII
jgi:acyl carrier protein